MSTRLLAYSSSDYEELFWNLRAFVRHQLRLEADRAICVIDRNPLDLSGKREQDGRVQGRTTHLMHSSIETNLTQ